MSILSSVAKRLFGGAAASRQRHDQHPAGFEAYGFHRSIMHSETGDSKKS